MGDIPKGPKITALIRFHPFNATDVDGAVDKAIDIIKQFNLDSVDVNALSTIIKGDKEQVFKLIETLYNTLEKDYAFSLEFSLSNYC